MNKRNYVYSSDGLLMSSLVEGFSDDRSGDSSFDCLIPLMKSSVETILNDKLTVINTENEGAIKDEALDIFEQQFEQQFTTGVLDNLFKKAKKQIQGEKVRTSINSRSGTDTVGSGQVKVVDPTVYVSKGHGTKKKLVRRSRNSRSGTDTVGSNQVKVVDPTVYVSKGRGTRKKL